VSKEREPTDLVTVQVQAWARDVLKNSASKGFARPQQALAAAVLAFAALSGEEKVRWLAKAQARAFDSGSVPTNQGG